MIITHVTAWYTAGVTFVIGIITSTLTLITPIKEELPWLLKKPTPTPIMTEETRILSKEEQATMSASFIKEFENYIASRSGVSK